VRLFLVLSFPPTTVPSHDPPVRPFLCHCVLDIFSLRVMKSLQPHDPSGDVYFVFVADPHCAPQHSWSPLLFTSSQIVAIDPQPNIETSCATLVQVTENLLKISPLRSQRRTSHLTQVSRSCSTTCIITSWAHCHYSGDRGLLGASQPSIGGRL